MRSRNVFIVVFLTAIWATGESATRPLAPPPKVQEALGSIRATSLRGDLSFLASDLLEGRDSPSRGLDIAANYIAAQFRAAGLEPGVAGDYFQNAEMLSVEPNFANFQVKLSRGEHELSVAPKDAVLRVAAALDIQNAPLFKLDLADGEVLNKLTASQLNGQIVITEYNPKLATALTVGEQDFARRETGAHNSSGPERRHVARRADASVRRSGCALRCRPRGSR